MTKTAAHPSPEQRVALYARYSSDLQSDASIEDQVRLCSEHAKKNGWTVVECYSDAGMSGASLMRPGIPPLKCSQSARYYPDKRREFAPPEPRILKA